MAAHDIVMAAGGASAPAVYIEDVFQTQLWTGTGYGQTVNNGIDLAGKGGMVWIKARVASGFGTPYDSHIIEDTNRGAGPYLQTNSTSAEAGVGSTAWMASFNSNGYSFGDNVDVSSKTYVGWTFRKQPKFFDVVTYTGNGSGAGQTISHNLGSAPGVIMVKCLDIGYDWIVYHRSLGTSQYLNLNLTGAAGTADYWNSTTPTATTFSVSASGEVNRNGSQYVAYIFAHNAGGFGLTGTDNVISCGSVTLNSSGAGTVNLGYEPQWVLMKLSSAADDWTIFDTTRGFSVVSGSGYKALYANTSGAEFSGSSTYFQLTNTGFSINMNFAGWQNQSLIYIAIRRGPMKVPTSGTSVFSPVAYTGDGGSPKAINAGFVADAAWGRGRTDTFNWNQVDRLRGSPRLSSNAASAEATSVYGNPTWDTMTGLNGVNGGTDNSNYNQSSMGYIFDVFRRAPSFFDVVCYTGTGSATTQTHNLGAVPEMIIVKGRNTAYGWPVYVASVGNDSAMQLQSTSTPVVSDYWNNTTPTASVFSLGTAVNTNQSTKTYVAYLFASCPGVSKIGSYTGTGTTKQVDCGFAAGARFVLIKRTDSTGDWYVWDSARGIVSNIDPYLLLNSTAVEVTNTDYIDTYSAGFEISSTAPAAINASGGTFIFLAIA